MMGADEDETVTDLDGDAISVPTRFTFPGRAGVHSAFTWSADNFNGCQADGKWKQWHAWDFESGDNLLGCEIRYADEATRDETIAWGKWLTDELDLDGYRLDAVKHILLSFVNEWLDEVAVPGERFVVSEVWSGDRDDLEAYAEATEGRTTFFDVPLHYALAAMSDGEGAYDMRDLRFAGFSEIHGSAAVTFVDNHDTVHEGGSLYSPVGPAWKGLAYAYVLTRSHGQPCLFYPDLYEPDDPTLSDDLRRLVAIRLEHAHGKGWEHDETDHDVYVYSRRGDDAHAGLLLLMNDGDDEATREVASFFPSAALVDATGHVAGEVVTDAEGKGDFAVPGRGYSIWVPALP
jgi:alpha-amylase